MFEVLETNIPGCFEIRPRIFDDQRGRFIKTFQQELFAEHGLNTYWPEEYYSVSTRDVLRGLHFQLPPHDHEKLVYCAFGEVLDAVVDLRVGSPTFGRHATFWLSAESANMLFIPRGLAHGFLTLSDKATMMYKAATVHAPEHDAGILWSSAGIDWPVWSPVLSQRDAGFVKLDEFDSPFRFEETPLP
jgi:dTDP-4-dehydrorhamnose 3,5-epimerase